jgi:glycosyltransferase involved in cell wall biosynthesis
MKQPTLSVCIPNYNHSRYICEALESVLAQTLPPTEIVVIDDASTDNSVEVIEGFVRRHSSIRLIRNSSNQGPFRSTNRVLSESRSEYFYGLAADDKVLPGFFEKCIALLERYPQSGMCSTYPKYIDALGNLTKFPSFHSHETHVNIRMACFLPPDKVLARINKQPWFIGGFAPVLFRRSALVDAGGQISELGLLADWFAVHFVALKYGMCYIPEPLVAFRIMPNSLGANIVRQPKVVMEQLVRSFRLMQEPKYHGVFPKSFIDSQRRNFTYASFRGAFVNWQSSYLQELEELVPPKTLLTKGMIWVLRSLMRFQWLMLKVYCYANIAPTFKEDHPMR